MALRHDADIALLPWPEQEERRQVLASCRLPRLLLVAPGHEPPALLDELEDWMRDPADPHDLHARCAVLSDRSRGSTTLSPTLDEDGLLWMGRAWVALTDAQVPVVEVLLDSLGRVVRFDVLAAAYEGAGGSTHPASIRSLLTRLGSRVRPLGLELVNVRRRGVMLAVTSEPRVVHR